MPSDYVNFHNDDEPNRDAPENGASPEQTANHNTGMVEAGQALVGLFTTAPPTHYPRRRAAHMRGIARRLRMAVASAEGYAAEADKAAEEANANAAESYRPGEPIEPAGMTPADLGNAAGAADRRDAAAVDAFDKAERDAQEQQEREERAAAQLPAVKARPWLQDVLADRPRELTPDEAYDHYIGEQAAADRREAAEFERAGVATRAAAAGALRECPRCGENDLDRLVWDRLGGETVTCQTCRKTFVPTVGPSA